VGEQSRRHQSSHPLHRVKEEKKKPSAMHAVERRGEGKGITLGFYNSLSCASIGKEKKKEEGPLPLLPLLLTPSHTGMFQKKGEEKKDGKALFNLSSFRKEGGGRFLLIASSNSSPGGKGKGKKGKRINPIALTMAIPRTAPARERKRGKKKELPASSLFSLPARTNTVGEEEERIGKERRRNTNRLFTLTFAPSSKSSSILTSKEKDGALGGGKGREGGKKKLLNVLSDSAWSG